MEGETKTYHMSIDISGVLRWPNQKLAKLFSDDNGHPVRGPYIRDWLRLQLAQGKQVLPMSKDCEGFDYQTGCPGHVQSAPESIAMNLGRDGN